MASDEFPYFNKRTGKTDMRPMQPNWYQRAYENMAYDSNIDKARKAYTEGESNMKVPSPSKYKVD